MSYEVDAANPDRAALDAAADALAGGGLVIFPTETVYGIAARPDVPAATDRLFDAKQRPSSLNVPVLTSSATEAWHVAEPTTGARALAAAFWPGPLTLVLRRTDRSRTWMLGDSPDTVAVRVPDHPVPLALLELTGPLAVTSANISGQPPAMDRDALRATVGDRAEVILVLPPDAPPPGGVASTVVDLTGGDIGILRRGAIPEAEIRRVVAGGSSQGR